MALSINIVLGANTVHFNRNIAKATKKAEQQLKGFAGFAQRALDKVNIGTLIGGGALYSLQQTSDQMQNLASKVRLATQSAKQYAAVQNQLRDIAQLNRASFEGVVDLYASSQRALSQLGKSQQEVIDFTHNMTMAMNIGGGSAQAQAAALTQLGQALASGALRGDEFNSVSEQAPILLGLIAKEMGVTTDALRKLAAEGKISADVVYRAVANATDSLKAMSDQMPMTISQGLQKVKNSYSYLVHDILNEQTKISQAMASALSFVADNMNALVALAAVTATVFGVQMAHGLMLAKIGADSLSVAMMTKLQTTVLNIKAGMAYIMSTKGEADAIDDLTLRWWALKETVAYYTNKSKEVIATTTAHTRSLVGLASGFDRASLSARAHTLAVSGVTAAKRTMLATTTLATRGVSSLGTAFMSLGRIINAHPLIALGSVVAALVVRTHGLKGAMDSLSETLRTVGVLFEWFVQGAADGLVALWDQAVDFFSGFGDGAQDTAAAGSGAFGGFFNTTTTGFTAVLEVAAKTFDLAGATVVTFFQNAKRIISNVVIGIGNGIKAIVNGMITAVEFGLNRIASRIDLFTRLVNQMGTFFGAPTLPQLGQVSLGRMQYTTYQAAPEMSLGAQIQANNTRALQNLLLKAHDAAAAAGQTVNDALASNGALAQAIRSEAAKAGRSSEEALSEAQKAIEAMTKAVNDQLNEFQSTIWDAEYPFMTPYLQMLRETGAQFGKFFEASNQMKDSLLDAAQRVTQTNIFVTLREQAVDMQRQVALLGKETAFDRLLYDFQDKNNVLSAFKDDVIEVVNSITGEIQKLDRRDFFVRSAIDYEYAKAQDALMRQNIEQQNQLELLTASNALARANLAIEHEKLAFVKQYQGLAGGVYEDEYQRFVVIAEQNAALKRQVVAVQEYQALVESMKTEDEKRLDTLKSQLDVILAQENIDTARIQRLLTGGSSVNKTPYDDLMGRTKYLQDQLDVAMQAIVDNERLTEQERINIKEWGAQERLKIEQAHSTAMNALVLSDSENMFGSLASITKDGLGEQSRLYRAMFAMQQGFAIAQATIAIQQAVSQGLAKGFPAGLADMAMAVSHGAKIVSAIKSVIMPVGQAHDGIMSVPKSGTWNLEKGERVLPKHTAKALDDKLDKIGNGGRPVNVVINNYSGENATTQQMPNGDVMVTIGKQMGLMMDSKLAEYDRKRKRQGWG